PKQEPMAMLAESNCFKRRFLESTRRLAKPPIGVANPVRQRMLGRLYGMAFETTWTVPSKRSLDTVPNWESILKDRSLSANRLITGPIPRLLGACDRFRTRQLPDLFSLREK